MSLCLGQRGPYQFWLFDHFEERFLSPIQQNREQKPFDDYDEVRHCRALIEQISQRPQMQMTFCAMLQQDACVGICLLTHGALDPSLFFKKPYPFKEPLERLLFFNYFHIAPSARGNGTWWLRTLLLPHFRQQGFAAVYLKSSHPLSFSLYRRLGEECGRYTTASDRGLFIREGRIFRIAL